MNLEGVEKTMLLTLFAKELTDFDESINPNGMYFLFSLE